MAFKSLTNGAVSGTGTLTCKDRRFGGCILNTDGSNQGTVVIRDNDASGRIIFDMVSTFTKHCVADIECAETIYYSITGTNADAQLYSRARTKP